MGGGGGGGLFLYCNLVTKCIPHLTVGLEKTPDC